MSKRVVIGLGYGDEGKGVTTEYLCSQDPTNTIVARFSGGQQAGHKVMKGDVEHIFSNFGAGTLSGCPTYWSQHCTFDPVAFCREYRVLKQEGADPLVFIHPEAMVTTPYDKHANQHGSERKHGTCGQGIFKTKSRTWNGISLYVRDILLLSPEQLDTMLEIIKLYYQSEQLVLRDFWNAVFDIKEMLGIHVFMTDTLPEYKHTVFEGSQGLMLDEYIGTMPHCTPSDMTPRLINHYGLDEIYLVTRCYQTRHGNGPMTNTDYPVEVVNNEHETNVTNEWQGEFRSTLLDLDQLIHAKREGIDKVIQPHTKVNLVVTCTDQLSEYELTHNGEHMVWIKPERFARFIAEELRIDGKVLINSSPYSGTIQEINHVEASAGQDPGTHQGTGRQTKDHQSQRDQPAPSLTG
jgi:adenylosuccinate synthase